MTYHMIYSNQTFPNIYVDIQKTSCQLDAIFLPVINQSHRLSILKIYLHLFIDYIFSVFLSSFDTLLFQEFGVFYRIFFF